LRWATPEYARKTGINTRSGSNRGAALAAVPAEGITPCVAQVSADTEQPFCNLILKKWLFWRFFSGTAIAGENLYFTKKMLYCCYYFGQHLWGLIMKFTIKIAFIFTALTSLTYANIVPPGTYSCPTAASVNSGLQISYVNYRGVYRITWKMQNPIIVENLPFIAIQAPYIITKSDALISLKVLNKRKVFLTPWRSGGQSMSCEYNVMLTGNRNSIVVVRSYYQNKFPMNCTVHGLVVVCP
jgi:hypothetical protein